MVRATNESCTYEPSICPQFTICDLTHGYCKNCTSDPALCPLPNVCTPSGECVSDSGYSETNLGSQLSVDISNATVEGKNQTGLLRTDCLKFGNCLNQSLYGQNDIIEESNAEL